MKKGSPYEIALFRYLDEKEEKTAMIYSKRIKYEGRKRIDGKQYIYFSDYGPDKVDGLVCFSIDQIKISRRGDFLIDIIKLYNADESAVLVENKSEINN